MLRCRNATQTAVVLEWDPVSLATAELRSLSLYRNGSKAGNIPRDKLSTKISGLQIDQEYTFHLVLRTSAGTYNSERLTVRTQKMTDLTGITVTPGVMPQQLRDSLEETVRQIGAKLVDTVRIDTTHFVCTEGRGQAWEKAVEMNIPVVVPDWVKGCQRDGRIVGVRGYYLNADPKLRQVAPMTINTSQQSSSQTNLSMPSQGTRPSQQTPRIEHTPPTPEQRRDLRAAPTSNGSDANTSEPPTPPPKMEAFPDAPTDLPEEDDHVHGHEHDESSIHGMPIRNKVQREEDEESAASEHTERGAAQSEEHETHAVEAAEEERKASALDAEGDGGFDEVTL